MQKRQKSATVSDHTTPSQNAQTSSKKRILNDSTQIIYSLLICHARPWSTPEFPSLMRSLIVVGWLWCPSSISIVIIYKYQTYTLSHILYLVGCSIVLGPCTFDPWSQKGNGHVYSFEFYSFELEKSIKGENRKQINYKDLFHTHRKNFYSTFAFQLAYLWPDLTKHLTCFSQHTLSWINIYKLVVIETETIIVDWNA